MKNEIILVDIGNTHFHIFDNEIYNLKEPPKLSGNIYYISVNRQKEKEFLKLNPNAIDLSKYVKFKTNYKGLGIDRIMACKSVDNGIVVDAGSAVTIDVMENGFHLGGIITPGIYAFRECFGKISEVLKYDVEVVDDILPNNTNDALNMGSVGAIKALIEKFAENKKIYFTGSDGKFLSKMFENSVYIEDLVFRGMKKTINELEKL